jgi:ribosomal protein S18 acetylase RimI-like enzyme
MHEAFSVYAKTGEPSGALLETPESLLAERALGRLIAGALVDEGVVGMVKHSSATDGSLYFSRLSVAPAFQGLGVARELFELLRVHAAELGLSGLSCHVRAREEANIALYEHLGMRVVSRAVKTSLTGAVIPVARMVG